jgi:hypothetical protein
MSLVATCRCGAQVLPLCGLLLVLAIVTGCGHPPAPPPAQAKPKTEASKTDTAAVAPAAVAAEYVSVFEVLPPQKGKDPFFPTSHRRDPAPEALPGANAPVDPVLVLKAVIRTSRNSQAVINNSILEEGEQEPVRVPNGHVRVRCIEIGNDYVLIQVEGEAEPKKLYMEEKKH